MESRTETAAAADRDDEIVTKSRTLTTVSRVVKIDYHLGGKFGSINHLKLNIKDKEAMTMDDSRNKRIEDNPVIITHIYEF